jgi:predicted secreted protein
MAKVAFLAHCLLNQNAKCLGGAKRPAMWEPVVDLLQERGWTIRQMACPELAFGGARRFWWVREQAETPLFRQHCRRIAKVVAASMEPHVQAGDDVVLIGIDSSPTMGVSFSPSAPDWGGEPNIGEDAASEWLTLAAEQVAEYQRTGYEVSLVDDGSWRDRLNAALVSLGSAPLS